MNEMSTLLEINKAKLESNPFDTNLICSTAEMAYQLGRPQYGIKLIENYLAQREDEWLLYRLADLHNRLGNYPAAELALSQLLEQGYRTKAVRELASQIREKMSEPTYREYLIA